ncbi:MAG: transketolase [Halobacteriovoraceae bacterium]|jgi:transketolase|nr:transketolase [Halobacteriovoraceae bacterium]
MSCSVLDLNVEAKDIRRIILEMAYKGNSGHIGCAFSITEIVLVLYSKFLRLDAENPKNVMRDFFVLSKGHGVMSLYACLSELGFVDKTHIENYFQDGSFLHGLGEYGVPGIEASGGSLGHGICVAQGMAFGLKRKKTDQKVFCLVGDGEINEGSFWETIMFSSHHQLDNLIIIIDANGYQAMGRTKDILDLGELPSKFISFGFDVFVCDGHDERELTLSIENCCLSKKPSVLIAQTVKGKGVSLFENNNEWHYKKMTNEVYEKATRELSQ